MSIVESGFAYREPLWGGLGTTIETAPTSKEAIKIAGLDWNVVQENMYTSDGVLIPRYKANVRDIDRKVLGIVTTKYKIVQNEDAFAWTDMLLGEGVTYETAGSLSSGKRVWMLARLEDRNLTDELVSPYLVFTNTHDGTGAVRVAITPIRVVCQNTLNLALQKAERSWSCSHMGDIESKMEDAKRTLLNTEIYMHELEEQFGELKLQKLTDDKVRNYIEMLIPIDENDTSKRRIINLQEAREELMDRYLFAPDLVNTERSAFRFVNAVSDYATHSEPNRKTVSFKENRFMKTVDGNALIDKAYQMVLEAV